MSKMETQLKLYMAAVELIAEQGYTATTVDAIADRAGVAKGTVFYNFGSKDGLFVALLDHGIQRLADTLNDALTDKPPGETPALTPPGGSSTLTPPGGAPVPNPPGGPASAPLQRLDAVVMAQLRFFEEYGAFARVLLAEMWRTTWEEAVARLRRQALGVYADVLREAVDAGELRADLDVETAATAVFGMVLTVSIERRALHPERPLTEVHATLTDLIHGRIAGTNVPE
ncbi:TetR/AcrR family transcriptional regulator [Sphaerisporangium sp. NPDC049002]|uniref:TetR/AcrR family transcriptional regulator n=1 Tax=unclassified Sphaerisporangium TaxID=2630420 RepID=UPI0033C0F979